jgi:hypothetical protein
VEDDYFDWTGGYQVGQVSSLSDKQTRKPKHPIGFSLPAKPKAKRPRKPPAKRRAR